ncbi:MAG: hypothetical protein M1830_001832 [Pleopsidium flavum]|nr:MAG: hypothetical protein M1830_001832 [Pleopsidium flavum]
MLRREVQDLDSRFTLHKRLAAKTTDTFPCPFGDDRVFAKEDTRWKHVRAVHPEYPQGSQDEGALAEFRGWLMNQSALKTSPTGNNGKPRSPQPKDSSSQEQSSEDSLRIQIGDDTGVDFRTKRPFSTSAITARSQRPEIGDIKNLSLEQEQDTASGDALSVRTGLSTPVSTLNIRKRPAGTDFSLSEALPTDRFSHEPTNPRRAKARSGGHIYSSKQVTVDPDFDRNVPVVGDIDYVRPVTGNKPILFDPSTDNLTTSFSRDIPHALGPTSTSRVYDARAHVFRSKKEPIPRRDDQLLERKEWHFNPQLRPRAGKHSSFQTPSTVDANKRHRQLAGQSGLPYDGTQSERDPELVRQPETRPISQEQLVAEVKGIYAGLVMVEAKCVEVDNKQALAAKDPETGQQPKLSNEQWQALIALHRTLLHEHHDFFLASQHPSASPALRRLAGKYTMPARMWRHGIHSFLELLRHRLPDSLDHMLAFIYLAYSMMALLYETVPTFEDTWIECLGDLGRYRMAIEDDDIRDREVWTGVSRFWYSKAADKSPTVGRLYHHLAILARPNALQQLFYYTRSLTCVHPFQSARESILTLFGGAEPIYHRSVSVDNLFIKIHNILFTKVSLESFYDLVDQLLPNLDNHIGRVTAKWKEQGIFIAVTNFAALFEYGLVEAVFTQAFAKVKKHTGTTEGIMTPKIEHGSHINVDDQPSSDIGTAATSTITVSHASHLTCSVLKLTLQRSGDKNVLPHIHVSLKFLLSLANVPRAMAYVEKDVPWGDIASFLNTLSKYDDIDSRIEDQCFPQPEKGVGRPLPEDFAIRGQIWSQGYFPDGWFENAMVDDEERSLELPSMAAPRVERILWLGVRIASYGRWLQYDSGSKLFSTTPYALELQSKLKGATPDRRSRTLSLERDVDTKMSGTPEVADEPKAVDDDTSEMDEVRLEQDPLQYQINTVTQDTKLHWSDVNTALKVSEMLRPYLTTLVADTDFFLSHLDVFELLLATTRCWSIVVSSNVITELTRVSTNDTKTSKAAWEAIQAIHSAIDHKAAITIYTSDDANVTKLNKFSDEQNYQFDFAGRTGLDNAIINAVKQQELSKREELYRSGADPDIYNGKTKLAVLITDDPSIRLKARAEGVVSVSALAIKSFISNQE